MTLTGTDMGDVSRVVFATVPASNVTVLSDTSVEVMSPPASHPGPVLVSVFNEANQGGAPACMSGSSCQTSFTYLLQPTVTGVQPVQGPSSGGTSVTITGTGFTAGCTVIFGGTQSTRVTFVNGGELTAISPPGAVGTVDVEVVSPGGTSGAETGDRFTYL